jgi:hypothetical protein
MRYIFGWYNKKEIRINQEPISSKPINILLKTLYYSYWQLVDLVIVTLHMVIVGILTVPIFIILLMTKLNYADYSLYNPDALVYVNDIIWRSWVVPFMFIRFELYV